MFKLVIEDDEGNKTVVPVIRDEISIGRQEGNTIRLTERNVSRRHAKLVKEEENLFVEEVSARYGTRKNGERIDGKARFDVGDVFLIGDYRLTLEGDTPKVDEKPEASAAPPKPEDRKPNPFSNAPTQITHRDEIEKRGGGTEILPAQPAKIVVVSSNFAGQEFPLNRKEMVIGRSDECDIIIDHRSVSQTHAKIVREAGGAYKIVDLNSKNGVKVSDEQYRAVHLKRGDVIELGHVKFRFVEPGENYVFTPHAGDEYDSSKASSKTGLIVLMVLFLGIVLVGVGMMMTGDDPEKAISPDDTKAATVDPKPKADEAKAEDKPDQWVADQIAKAQSELETGHPERASVLLEATRDYPSASSDQREKIDELLSTARRERPLETELEQGRASYDKGEYVDALAHFKKIPPSDDSPIYQILEKEGLAEKAVEKLVSQANAAAQEKEFESAEELVDEILLFDSENADALALREMMEESKAKQVAAAKARPDRKPDRTPRPEKKDPQEAINAAQAALLSGDTSGAISNCKGVRNARCYRILGVAYKKTGDTDRSCKYFERAGMEAPHCK